MVVKMNLNEKLQGFTSAFLVAFCERGPQKLKNDVASWHRHAHQENIYQQATWMSQEVSKWLVLMVITYLYMGYLGVITHLLTIY